jgi:hypothetical protein
LSRPTSTVTPVVQNDHLVVCSTLTFALQIALWRMSGEPLHKI